MIADGAHSGGSMKFNRESFKWWAELTLTCTSLVALPVGGWWAFHNFSVEDTHEANPNITVTVEVQPFSESSRLQVVHVKPKNVGKIPIELDGGKKGDINIDVRVSPAKLPDGLVSTDALPVKFRAANIVSRFNGGYVMEPGIDYDEVETFIVPKDATYIVRAEMDNYDQDPTMKSKRPV
ncbi:hypothetical protein [Paraburkholderia sp. JHI869]|uniref:hypothetical protein n=1 Tax=Paraburkholderia sp. JHI869 TaxID=3112959 RepID=UPI0031738E12